MDSHEIREAIKQLPIHQRAVTIALKNIFDQIKALTKQEQDQIDANHLSFISKFKVLEKKASQIIKGKPLREDQLDNSGKFFTQSENPQKQKLMKESNKIENYWLNCMENSDFGQELTEQQRQILQHVTDLSTNITTDSIELTVTIQKNDIVEAGVFHRKLVLDNGMPVNFEGQQPKYFQTKSEGVWNSYILNNTKQISQLNIVFATIGNLVNQVIPYSLEYYLGTVEGEEINYQEEGEQQEEGEDEQA